MNSINKGEHMLIYDFNFDRQTGFIAKSLSV
jgi:hypothetical protein